jgi:hypothetical protein
VDEETTDASGISIRLLAPGDEGVVRELATYDGPGTQRRWLGETSQQDVEWTFSYADD